MMLADSRLGTVRTARSCKAAQINSAIAAPVKAQDRMGWEIMIDPFLSGSHFACAGFCIGLALFAFCEITF
jgi:hypothetical protein